jgi:uncharacterized RDD family membrane protein YckC
MFCPYCGATNRDGAAFCTSCRATIPALPVAASPAPQALNGREYQPEAYARFRRRAAAFVIDSIVSFIAGVPLFLVAAFTIPSGENDDPLPVFGAIFAFYIGATAYFIVSDAYGGGVGKRLLALRVVRADDGSNPGFGRAILRAVIRGCFMFGPFSTLTRGSPVDDQGRPPPDLARQGGKDLRHQEDITTMTKSIAETA